MIATATKPCSLCGVEYAVSSYPPRRRQCLPCRRAYFRRWKAGIRVSSQEFSETMRRASRPAPKPIAQKDRDAALEYAVDLYRIGSKDPSPADVLDAIEPDIWKWLKLANWVVRMAEERG